jgi:multiple antibiotic resistance protein
MLSLKETIASAMTLFSVINIVGNIPYIIKIRQGRCGIQSGKAVFISAFLMITFLFLGDSLLWFIGLDPASFAVAGAVILFIIALEMILGITLMQEDTTSGCSSSVVPLAFPLIAGTGTLTTIISLRTIYGLPNILLAIFLNVLIIYLVLLSSPWLERKIGETGFSVLRKVFGIVVLAIAVKIVKTNLVL